MSLIQDMLNNLEQSNNPKKKSSVKKTKEKAGRPKRKLLVPIAIVCALALIVSFALIMPKYYQATKTQLSSLLAKLKPSASSNQASAATASKPLRIVEPAKLKSSRSVHQQYATAINLLNEGKIEQAITTLKSVMKEDPKFTPAKKTYDNLIRQYRM